ncbi:MAG: pyruvate:ferredoxin (flavodoxin) oxidoreductase, partial [Thermoplasmata archaeon]|nr:pyruvate:ferredoxin (flavodoxin) oxidoreductase [Thermoplasmata archaeon]
MKFRIQVSTLDCVGCGNCEDICPSKEKSLIMKPFASQEEKQVPLFDYSDKLPIRFGELGKYTVKGSQLRKPLLEYSGACGGCGETPYLKLITQLYGDKMIISNATGCSSIWGGSAPSVPFATNAEGHGPAWANSLFEDNAEYGFGMMIANTQRRNKLADIVKEAMETNVKPELNEAFKNWLENAMDPDLSKEYGDQIKAGLDGKSGNKLLDDIFEAKDMLTKISQWVVGGDGWAYDIGYGGLDHVMAMGEEINILVLDTEVYSNTGGQSSKATPIGSVAKFAASGKKTVKKDLGMMFMSYGYVYVASVAMGANKNQLIKAIREAESYPGPSIIIAYAPCINHGIKAGMVKSQEEEKLAVEAGYWPLYRFDPRLTDEGKNPFQLDYKEPNGKIRDFLMGEVRYSTLTQSFPEEAERLHTALAEDVEKRYKRYKAMAEQ